MYLSCMPGYTKIPCRVTLDLLISSVINPLPMVPWALKGALCTFNVLLVGGIEVETAIPVDLLVLPVIWSHKLKQEGLCQHASRSQTQSLVSLVLKKLSLSINSGFALSGHMTGSPTLLVVLYHVYIPLSLKCAQ